MTRLAQLDLSDLQIPLCRPEHALLRFRRTGGGLQIPPKDYWPDLHTLVAIAEASKPATFGAGTPAFYTVVHDDVFYRVTMLTTVDGVKLHFRRPVFPIPTLQDLGFTNQVVRLMVQAGQRRGLTVVVGKTGAGKTTTSSATLQEWLNEYGGQAITLENPPECRFHPYVIARNNLIGTCDQLLVTRDTVAAQFEGVLRARPTHLFFGEVKTPQEASLVLNAALSGHMVLTTIHGNDIQGGLYRLETLAAAVDGPIARDLLASALQLAMYVDYEANRMPALEYGWLAADEQYGSVRAMIRAGQINELASQIDQQRARVLQGAG